MIGCILVKSTHMVNLHTCICHIIMFACTPCLYILIKHMQYIHVPRFSAHSFVQQHCRKLCVHPSLCVHTLSPCEHSLHVITQSSCAYMCACAGTTVPPALDEGHLPGISSPHHMRFASSSAIRSLLTEDILGLRVRLVPASRTESQSTQSHDSGSNEQARQ